MSSIIELPKGSLAELTDYLQAAFDTLEDIEDPELKKQAEADIDRYLEAEVRKVDGIDQYIRTCENRAAEIRNEIARLHGWVSRWENRRERIRNYVKFVMQRSNMQKLEGKLAAFSLRMGQPSVLVANESLIPDEFKVVEVRIDRQLIAKALKSGREVPGAALVQGDFTLVRR